MHLLARRRAPWWLVVLTTLCSLPYVVIDSIADDGLVNDLTTRIFWLVILLPAVFIVAAQVVMWVRG